MNKEVVTFCYNEVSYNRIESRGGDFIHWWGWQVWANSNEETCPFCGGTVLLAEIEVESCISPFYRGLEDEKVKKRAQAALALHMINENYKGEVPLIALYEEGESRLHRINPTFFCIDNKVIDVEVDPLQKGRFIGEGGKWVKRFIQRLQKNGLTLGQIKERPRKLIISLSQ